MRLVSLALVAACLVLFYQPAQACSVCGCGDPMLATSDPAAITGKLRFQADVELLQVNAGTDGMPGYTDELTQWSYRLNGVYRPIDDLAVSATLPMATKTINTVGGGTSTQTSRLTGLGDVELGARYAVWRSVDLGIGRVQEIAVSAGTSFPTGANGATDATGERVDEHGQLGTGSFGPYAGLHYRFEQVQWEAFASVSGRMHNANSYDYTYGPAVLWSVHGQYRPMTGLALDLGVDGRYAKADTDHGASVDSTGGWVLAASPGVYVKTFGDLWVFARGQVPFWERLFGDQKVKPTVLGGLQYQIL